MNALYANCPALKAVANNMKDQKNIIQQQSASITKISNRLHLCLPDANLQSSLSNAKSQLDFEIKTYQKLCSALLDISTAYINTETNISNQSIDIDSTTAPVSSDSSTKDTEFEKYLNELMDELSHFPPNLKRIKDLIWKMWDTDTGNQIEKDFFSTFDDIISKFLAFEYNSNNDYYYTDENYGIQRYAGFMDLFDDLGPLLGMDLDTEILTFTPEGSDKEFRLQFWKGSYGFDGAYGGEIGYYSRNVSDAQSHPYASSNPFQKFVHYDCVSGADEIETTQEIYSTDHELLFSNSTSDYADNDDHFWNLAIKTDPGYDADDLVVLEHLIIDDEATREAIIEACEKNDNLQYNEELSSGNEIVIQYGKFDN